MVTREDCDVPSKDDDNMCDASEESSEEEEEEGEEEDKLMMDDVENAEKLMFDFEAYPICHNDKEGIINLLTQIFLRADINVEQMADTLVEQSPFGCVYRPAEEFLDEDDEGVVYGVLSMFKLGTDQKLHKDIWTLLKIKARKYAVDRRILSILDNLSAAESSNCVGLFINERLLHFPAAIAAPAFKSLMDDLKKSGSQYCFSHVFMILKIRIADSNNSQETGGPSFSGISSKRKKKLSKAQKRRIAANAVADADVIFDNPEEELLFQGVSELDYFQYPVQSDVEKDSKFSSVVLKGITYRPYRRVCILDNNAFHRYLDIVSKTKGL